MTLPIRIETLLGPLFVAIFALALSVPCFCASAQASMVSADSNPGACACSHGEGSGDSEDTGCCCGCDVAEEAPRAPVVADTSGGVTADELHPKIPAAPLLLELPTTGVPEGVRLALGQRLDPSPPWRSFPSQKGPAAEAAPTYLRVQTLRL